jgi:hypothetical protein
VAIAVAIAVGGLVLAACTPVSTAAPKPTPPPVVILTQSRPAGDGCDGALLEGMLVPDPATGLAIADGSGRVQAVVWPFGYRGAATIAGALLIDAAGGVVARTGDRIRVGGGQGADGHWIACGTIVRLSG